MYMVRSEFLWSGPLCAASATPLLLGVAHDEVPQVLVAHVRKLRRACAPAAAASEAIAMHQVISSLGQRLARVDVGYAQGLALFHWRQRIEHLLSPNSYSRNIWCARVVEQASVNRKRQAQAPAAVVVPDAKRIAFDGSDDGFDLVRGPMEIVPACASERTDDGLVPLLPNSPLLLLHKGATPRAQNLRCVLRALPPELQVAPAVQHLQRQPQLRALLAIEPRPQLLQAPQRNALHAVGLCGSNLAVVGAIRDVLAIPTADPQGALLRLPDAPCADPREVALVYHRGLEASLQQPLARLHAPRRHVVAPRIRGALHAQRRGPWIIQRMRGRLAAVWWCCCCCCCV
mmetsp:Transcript_30929/g.79417  ORF Transcript_30929/g.79417 Transcript_30929/m.79417 type:complete len:345 (+) Transcript_30929:48-1082(+)